MKKKSRNHKAKPKAKWKEEAAPYFLGKKKKGRCFAYLGYGSLPVVLLAIWVAHQQTTSTSTTANPGSARTQLRRLFRHHCRKPQDFCSEFIQVDGRELKVSATVGPNTQLVTISRSSQIWDIDALRSPLIQNLNLLQARHSASSQPLNNIAYLAAYLALRNRDDDVYLQYLPTYQDFKQFHPVAMEEEYLRESLGGEHSYAFQLISLMKKTIRSEYEAFCNSSPQFKKLVSTETYTESRILVMSRSFHLSQTNVELTSYEQQAFRHLDTVNSYSMVPLLDALDHQYSGTNMAWGRMTPEGDIGIMSTQEIKAGQALLNKYSSHESQEYMFAIYGFLLGNEPLSRSVNAYHRTVQPQIERTADWQSRQLLHYLAHDDGYPHCIEPGDHQHPMEYAFKRIKLSVLEMIANNPRYWVVRLPSRRNHPPAFDSDISNHDFDTVLQTCRLLAMTHGDYNGSAQQVLLNALSHGSLQHLQKDSNGLELRAWTWLRRLARVERNKYHGGVGSLKQLTERISMMEPMSNDWAFAQLQFGEIQALDYIIDHAHHAIEQMIRKELSDAEDISSLMIREDACPLSTVLPLLF